MRNFSGVNPRDNVVFASAHGASDSFEQAQDPSTEKGIGSVRFLPAYDEVPSPGGTEPPTPETLSPEPMYGVQMVNSRRSNDENSQASRKGTRIARLATSLFSSRAVVKGMDAPTSPRSNSSSDYVGWPGTQDKNGGTVPEESDTSTEPEKVHRLSEARVNSLQELYGNEEDADVVGPLSNAWVGLRRNPSDDAMSDLSMALSGTSSAYFNDKDVRAIRSGKLDNVRGVGQQRKAAAAVMRFKRGESQLSEENLALKDHFSPPHKNYNASQTKGYRGFLDKTKDVPNLMDGTESEVSNTVSQHQDSMDEMDQIARHSNPYKQNTNQNLNVVLLGGGLTTIQTTADHFSMRKTASDFDENLTNSDYDQYGFAKIPGFNEMATAGRGVHDQSLSINAIRARQALEKYKNRDATGGSDSGSEFFSDPYAKDSWGRNVKSNLKRYYVHPDEMKILVNKYRNMSKNHSTNLSYDDLDREEDGKKAFALSEMRSRIMEKDVERGLERQGGTTVVDDIALTPSNRAALRVRDALVVAKAWRDGATPKDMKNASLLTRRAEHSHFILRPNREYFARSRARSVDRTNIPKYTWEEKLWVDDLEMSQYQCHSLGPRHLRGFEMFTIGDCQSMLLKLCNERCMELRFALNEATARQLEAEEVMKDEADFTADGMMTEAEMTYLASMEEVKTISHKLVVAEKSFNLVRDRIERLVAKYEALLVKFENDNESVAPSSVITASSYYSEYSCTSFEEREREKDMLARRAERAELRAELAAREAMLAKKGARAVRAEKESELAELQQRLCDLQSESSAAITEREHSVVLARAITANNRSGTSPKTSGGVVSKSKIDDVKQRFRNRSAAKMQGNGAVTRSNIPPASNSRGYPSSSNYARDAAARQRSILYRAVGEEMFQQLDFYERSLKVVDETR